MTWHQINGNCCCYQTQLFLQSSPDKSCLYQMTPAGHLAGSHRLYFPLFPPAFVISRDSKLGQSHPVCFFFFFCLTSAVFPVWRGIGAGNGVGGGWSQGWGRCLRWETDSPGPKPRIPIFDYPVWLVRCQGGRARLIEVCQRGRGAIRLPTDMLSIKLPRLYDIHQVPKVKKTNKENGRKMTTLVNQSTHFSSHDAATVASRESEREGEKVSCMITVSLPSGHPHQQ